MRADMCLGPPRQTLPAARHPIVKLWISQRLRYNGSIAPMLPGCLFQLWAACAQCHGFSVPSASVICDSQVSSCPGAAVEVNDAVAETTFIE